MAIEFASPAWCEAIGNSINGGPHAHFFKEAMGDLKTTLGIGEITLVARGTDIDLALVCELAAEGCKNCYMTTDPDGVPDVFVEISGTFHTWMAVLFGLAPTFTTLVGSISSDIDRRLNITKFVGGMENIPALIMKPLPLNLVHSVVYAIKDICIGPTDCTDIPGVNLDMLLGKVHH